MSVILICCRVTCIDSNNICLTGNEDSAYTADAADEGGLWEIQKLEEQEGQRGAAAEGEGMGILGSSFLK